MKKRNIAVIIIVSIALILTVGSVYYFSNDKDNAKQEKNNKVNKVNEDNSDEANFNESQNENVNDDIVIKDESFVTAMNEIFINVDSYIGRTLKVEGIAKNVEGENFSVVRLYDMKDNDHNHEVTVGVNATYKGNPPREDSWVEISGKIEKRVIDGKKQPIILVENIQEKETWGQKKVYN